MLRWGSENMIKVITNLMNLPNAGQPVCSQPKHTHQQHQYSCSIFNVVVQFASNPTQSEQPDHLQRAEQTAYALKTDRKAEMWVHVTQSLNLILVSTQFCFRKLSIWGLSMHLHTRLHVLTAFTWKMLMQSQIQTRVSYSQPLFIDALSIFFLKTFQMQMLRERKTKDKSTEVSSLTHKWQKCKHKDEKRWGLNVLRSF